MIDNAEFYARVRERIAAARSLMDGAKAIMRNGDDLEAAVTLLDMAKNEQALMLVEMQQANAERAS